MGGLTEYEDYGDGEEEEILGYIVVNVCEIFWTFNATIATISYVCKESLGVVDRTYTRYKKLPVSLQDGRLSQGAPFLYINYNVDTVYIELCLRSKEQVKSAIKNLSLIKHLAVAEGKTYEGYPDRSYYDVPELLWDEVRTACLQLKNFRFGDCGTQGTTKSFLSSTFLIILQKSWIYQNASAPLTKELSMKRRDISQSLKLK